MDRTRTRQALLMVMARPDLEADEFARKFAVHAGATHASPDGVDYRWARLLGADEVPRVPHQVFMRESPPPFDAVIQVAAARPADLATAATGALGRLAEIIAPAETAALVCDEVRITQGDGPIFVVMVLARRKELSREEFMARWFGRHAAIGEAVEGVRYRQLHVVDGDTGSLGAALALGTPRIDGVATSYFETIAEAVQILASEAVAVGALADEKTFIDHTASRFGLYTTYNARPWPSARTSPGS